MEFKKIPPLSEEALDAAAGGVTERTEDAPQPTASLKCPSFKSKDGKHVAKADGTPVCRYCGAPIDANS